MESESVRDWVDGFVWLGSSKFMRVTQMLGTCGLVGMKMGASILTEGGIPPDEVVDIAQLAYRSLWVR
jgi:hypothetical protein